ncbi:hypothetical protein Z043_117703 [Scleropages formosus]|uniref:Uncharacterized protein n=1 Tax=Scleropages formosus TaxID=113540 RepID=A0A0N8JXK5_SCLFO|nr:hypothetical protein Z043_117703 [Scleropages formosus]
MDSRLLLRRSAASLSSSLPFCRSNLQKEKESFLAEHGPEGPNIVAVSLSLDDLSTYDKLRLLRSALRECLALLRSVMSREEELGYSDGGQGEYESMRNTVRDRLEHLLHSTELLLEETRTSNSPQVPDGAVSVEPDEVDGAFQAKVWTYRVLQELVHWTRYTSQTLHILHAEWEAEGQQTM